MSRDILNRLRGSCLDCGECPSFISISGRVLCDYCGCPPTRHEWQEDDNVKDLYKTTRSRKPLRDSTNIQQVKGEVLSRKSSNSRAPVKKFKEEIPPNQAAPPAANPDRKRKNMGSSLSRLGKAGRRRSLDDNFTYSSPSHKMPYRLCELLHQPEADTATQQLHGWNKDDKSVNISVKEDDTTVFHRHPVAQSTDCVRTLTSYTSGLHAFKLSWRTRQRGTHALVGVATQDAALHAVGYTALLGRDANSWAWNLGRSKACHNDKHVQYPVNLEEEEATFSVPDSFVMVLDMDAGTLAFVVNDQYLGVAHSGLKGKKLFPVISTVWGNCEISIKYHGGLEPEPLPLMNLCRQVIRNQIGKKRIEQGSLKDLNLPKSITKYLEYKNC